MGGLVMASAVVRLVLAAGLLGPVASSVVAQEQAGIATYRNERHGFSLAYPAGTFAPQPPAADGEGRVFVSRDGNARLLAGALPNADGVNLRDYARWCCSKAIPAPPSTTRLSAARGSCC